MYGGDADFYSIKGMVEGIFDAVGIEDAEYEPCKGVSDAFDEAAAFHPGRCAVVSKDGVALGILGELHPKVLENYGIEVRAYAAKLNVPEMMSAAVLQKTYKPLPKYPATTRDLAVVCDDSIPVAKLEKAIKDGIGGKILETITLFDVYKGKQIESGKKSVAFSIVLRSSEGTLTDEQADNAVKKALKKLSEIGAELRQ